MVAATASSWPRRWPTSSTTRSSTRPTGGAVMLRVRRRSSGEIEYLGDRHRAGRARGRPGARDRAVRAPGEQPHRGRGRAWACRWSGRWWRRTAAVWSSTRVRAVTAARGPACASPWSCRRRARHERQASERWPASLRPCRGRRGRRAGLRAAVGGRAARRAGRDRAGGGVAGAGAGVRRLALSVRSRAALARDAAGDAGRRARRRGWRTSCATAPSLSPAEPTRCAARCAG